MILTRSTRLIQPQGPVELSPEFGDAVAFVPGAVNPTFATRTTRVLTTEGRAERGSAATGGVSPSTAAYIAFPEASRTFLGNKPHWAFIAGNIANTSASSWIFGAGRPSANAGILLTYLASTGRLEFATRFGDTWYSSTAPVTLSANRDFEAGYSIDADGTLRLYWDRREVLAKTGVGATTPTPNLPPTAGMAYASQANNNLYGNSSSIAFAAFGQSAYSDRMGERIAANPWQLFRPVQRRVYFDMGAGGTTEITLLGTNGSQSNIADLDAIAQSHYLISASDKQYTTGSIDPITLSQSLSVTSSESRNTTSSGTISQTHALLATQASQKNVGAGGSVILEQTFSAQLTSSATTSTASAISQIHALVGQATTQSNVSLTPSISQAGSFVAVSARQTTLSSPASISQAQTISATQSNQATVASTASITQSHQISSQSVNQAQVSSTDQISLTQALTVVAANQSNIAPPVVIVQGNVSAAATGVQNNTASLGTITQTQTLVGESSQSTNVGSTATISQTIDLSAVAANQHAIGDSNTIWQAQFVQSQTATQSNTASVGAISTVPVIWLSAAISDQVSTSPAASITQDHNFAIIPGSSRNVSISGIIAQIHELYAIAANQATISIGGQVAVIDYSQTPSIYTATSPLIRYSADSPQIVYQVFATK